MIEEDGAIFQIFWSIWKARNVFVFRGKIPIPEEVIEQASRGNSDYLSAVLSKNPMVPRGVSQVERWVSPPPSSLNCDGAHNSSCSLVAFGVVVRDHSGSAQVWRYGQVKVSSALAIEAWALRIACGLAMEYNFPSVILESDCKILIEMISGSSSLGCWEIQAIVEDIKSWARDRQWPFVCGNRSKNKAAHWIATSCLDRKITSSTGCIPPELDSILRKDSR
ncbi:uncharacterized protein LOC131327506 [Rhododendron vialii]|uniref:uncharacterized protein LOC131327506 n=1 Tax=Rhododendron vialii TaxID=182163 RepID=UPI00265F899E|nr:uncharacterized protein LOC131327506 [Rhododendron vialii]